MSRVSKPGRWPRRIVIAWYCGLLLMAAAPAATPAPDGFIVVNSLDELRACTDQPGVKVRLKPGTYVLDQARSRQFITISADDSRWDLRGVKLRIDTKLFRAFGPGRSPDGPIYCVFALTGNRLEFEGLTTENFGDSPGIQSRNKIFNITGAGVVLRNVDLTTTGSSPWGYGSLYGISGGDVRKMNGIRVGWPARDVKLIGCRVHMRAMGHGIFIQGASDTLIEDCHVDGLLRPTDEILAEPSGYAFERGFRASHGVNYSEGVTLGPDGRILPGEMIALSEDGIRLYPADSTRRPTGRTTIVGCTVTRMRRGICTGLGPAADTVINCEARECVATGFHLGTGDVLRGSRADARYSEAVCVPSANARDVAIDLEILDSRQGCANTLVAVINGRNHRVNLQTSNPAFIPDGFTIELGSCRGYASYQRTEPSATDIHLRNETAATVVRSGPRGDSPAPSVLP